MGRLWDVSTLFISRWKISLPYQLFLSFIFRFSPLFSSPFCLTSSVSRPTFFRGFGEDYNKSDLFRCDMVYGFKDKSLEYKCHSVSFCI